MSDKVLGVPTREARFEEISEGTPQNSEVPSEGRSIPIAADLFNFHESTPLSRESEDSTTTIDPVISSEIIDDQRDDDEGASVPVKDSSYVYDFESSSCEADIDRSCSEDSIDINALEENEARESLAIHEVQPKIPLNESSQARHIPLGKSVHGDDVAETRYPSDNERTLQDDFTAPLPLDGMAKPHCGKPKRQRRRGRR
ncbi:hypothetical protein FOZ63_009939 [Perkinsus olseni]|uniref:Uncharacterized protein n=1 Tax=Perkinsus olseni TaxID=32597 RepID=A0A7J6R0N1_PEROL|nr:hypothetical protein FOZ60_016150 [Perkinsus olseni]KAF4714255.1 hypothetical protein FOZ62_030600 [Perkinsus olseni]KAF4749454.1 hypothetical protein FOZ63_009939 [Perkinsus olseni]